MSSHWPCIHNSDRLPFHFTAGVHKWPRRASWRDASGLRDTMTVVTGSSLCKSAEERSWCQPITSGAEFPMRKKSVCIHVMTWWHSPCFTLWNQTDQQHDKLPLQICHYNAKKPASKIHIQVFNVSVNLICQDGHFCVDLKSKEGKDKGQIHVTKALINLCFIYN